MCWHSTIDPYEWNCAPQSLVLKLLLLLCWMFVPACDYSSMESIFKDTFQCFHSTGCHLESIVIKVFWVWIGRNFITFIIFFYNFILIQCLLSPINLDVHKLLLSGVFACLLQICLFTCSHFFCFLLSHLTNLLQGWFFCFPYPLFWSWFCLWSYLAFLTKWFFYLKMCSH